MEIIEIDSSLNVMANKTFVVTMIQSDPYVMLKQEVSIIMQFKRCKTLSFVISVFICKKSVFFFIAKATFRE